MLKGHFAANSLCGKYDAKKKLSLSGKTVYFSKPSRDSESLEIFS
jgi:hypothetical protein